MRIKLFNPSLSPIATGSILTASLVVHAAHAGPVNPNVIEGLAEFEHTEEQTTIHQNSQNVFIEYDEFSIDANERVRFIQPNSDAIAVNYVTGANPSEIFGDLTANGQIYLINENGVLFGETANVNVNSLLVSTLAPENSSDFSAMTFSGSHSGAIVNQADIDLGDESSILFISPDIENSGQLSAQNIDLVSAGKVIVYNTRDDIAYEIERSALSGRIENTGVIEGNQLSLNADIEHPHHITSISNSGEIRATGFEEVNGEIRIVSHNAGRINNSGHISADANEFSEAGLISIDGDDIIQQGQISADGKGNKNAGDVSLTSSSQIVLTETSHISADADNTGDGGHVTVFSYGNTYFDESALISAQGGDSFGNGGFIEVSGIQYVAALGRASTYAAHGQSGTYLIDPTDITINNSGSNAFGSFINGVWQPGNNASSIIDVDSIEQSLQDNGTVIINTNSPAGSNGDITVDGIIDINGRGTNTLELIANRDIVFTSNGDIIDSNLGQDAININLTADRDIDIANGRTFDLENSNMSLNAVTGNVTLPDEGISIDGRFIVNSLDIEAQSSRVIDITSNETLLTINAPLDDITINADTRNFDARIMGDVNLNLNLIGNSHLLDLNADSNALFINNGNLYITTTNGDLTITDNITAQDLTDDNLRAGLIDMAVENGNFSFNDGVIASINAVDQSATGGLGNFPTEQVSIRIRNTSTDDSSYTFEFGDDTGLGDTELSAQGGDIYIDAKGAANTPGTTTLNGDVIIRAYNDNPNATDGELNNFADIDNGAQFFVQSGRRIDVELEPVIVITPEPTPRPTPDTGPVIDEELVENINQNEESQQEVETVEDQQVAPGMTNLDTMFSLPVDNCNSLGEENEQKQCLKNQQIKAFLNMLWIDGEVQNAQN